MNKKICNELSNNDVAKNKQNNTTEILKLVQAANV